MIYIKRTRLLDVPIDCIDFSQALSAVKSSILSADKISIFAVNPEKVVRATRSPDLKRQLDNSKLLIPDGIGVVLALRSLGYSGVKRVAGADLMPAICNICAQNGKSVFLLGATSESVLGAASFLQSRISGLVVAGTHDGFFSDISNSMVVDKINASGASVLFVAMGSPKQENWISDNFDNLQVNVIQGVGGTFDVLSGKVSRAPYFFRRIGLEWLYRLLSNPSRFYRQASLLVFIYWFVKNLIGRLFVSIR